MAESIFLSFVRVRPLARSCIIHHNYFGPGLVVLLKHFYGSVFSVVVGFCFKANFPAAAAAMHSSRVAPRAAAVRCQWRQQDDACGFEALIMALFFFTIGRGKT